MSEKSWKDVLLSSGTPLEYSVLRALADLGIIDPAEHRYQRVNEHGVPTEFSIDVHATDIDTTRNMWLELFIECKYRHDSTRWMFTPIDYAMFDSPSFRDAFITVDELDTERRFSSDVLGKYSQTYPTCGKGAELTKSDGNQKSIREAMSQLQYGLADRVVDAIVHQADGLLGKPTPVFLLVPIIVTTAELWRLKPGTTIENIRMADELGAVAERHELLLLHERPNNQLRQYSRERLTAGLVARHRAAMDRALALSSSGSFDLYVESFTRTHPSLFVVIHYSRFRASIERLLAFVKQPQLLEARPFLKAG